MSVVAELTPARAGDTPADDPALRLSVRGLAKTFVLHPRGGVSLPVGGMFTGLLENDLRCCLLEVPADHIADRFPTADGILGAGGYRVLQFVWPDRTGRLPWDDDYDERLRLAQPVIGTWD